MSKAHSPLRDALRDMIAEKLEDGGTTARAVAAALAKEKPKIMREFGQGLALDALTEMARSELKRWQGVRSAPAQLVLPEMLRDRLTSLPACINIPGEDGETFYRPLHKATVGELRACITARQEQLMQDAAVLRDLRELLDERLYSGARDGDLLFPQPAKREMETA